MMQAQFSPQCIRGASQTQFRGIFIPAEFSSMFSSPVLMLSLSLTPCVPPQLSAHGRFPQDQMDIQMSKIDEVWDRWSQFFLTCVYGGALVCQQTQNAKDFLQNDPIVLFCSNNPRKESFPSLRIRITQTDG